MKSVCTFLLALLLSGCSTVRLVYDNAETYLHWRAATYLDLEGAMADELDERIAAFMAWHRAQALPKYVQLTEDATRRFERRLQPADLVWGTIPSLRRREKACAKQRCKGHRSSTS